MSYVPRISQVLYFLFISGSDSSLEPVQQNTENQNLISVFLSSSVFPTIVNRIPYLSSLTLLTVGPILYYQHVVQLLIPGESGYKILFSQNAMLYLSVVFILHS